MEEGVMFAFIIRSSVPREAARYIRYLAEALDALDGVGKSNLLRVYGEVSLLSREG